MGAHPNRVAHELDTAITARDRLPRTWAVYLSGAATWRGLDTAVQQLGGLAERHWAGYDVEAARLVTASTRLKRDLRIARERLQDDTAPQRARAAALRRAVLLEEHEDGQASLVLTGPAPQLVALDQALTRSAVLLHGSDGEGRTVGQLRFDIAADLLTAGITQAATPGAVLPERRPVDVQLVLTIPALAWVGRTAEQAQLAGYGPIDLDTARELAGAATSMVRVLTDPVTGVRTTMDRKVYAPPADLRRWIGIRDQRCRFPGCRRPAHLCDLDHAREWHEGGVTDDTNLITACRIHHTEKTADLWQEELLVNGSVPWTNPWGQTFTDPSDIPADPAPTDLLPTEPEPDDPAPF